MSGAAPLDKRPGLLDALARIGAGDVLLVANPVEMATGAMIRFDAGVIQRFLGGERDIRLATSDRLADTLGLRLVEAAGGMSRRRGRARRVALAVEVPAVDGEAD